MIGKRKSTKLDGFKHYYVSLTVQLNSHLSTQLNEETVLFQVIQLSLVWLGFMAYQLL